jgi:hypothetical protein
MRKPLDKRRFAGLTRPQQKNAFIPPKRMFYPIFDKPVYVLHVVHYRRKWEVGQQYSPIKGRPWESYHGAVSDECQYGEPDFSFPCFLSPALFCPAAQEPAVTRQRMNNKPIRIRNPVFCPFLCSSRLALLRLYYLSYPFGSFMHMIGIPPPSLIGFCIASFGPDCYNFKQFVAWGAATV